MTQVGAAEAFGVARKTIWLWLETHRKGGEMALAAKKRGPKGERGNLKGWQAATVCRVIRDRCPDQLKLPFFLWTSEAVRQLIRRKFGVRLSGRTARRYLRRWGFTPQKPKRAAYERDPEAVTRWMQEEYPAIRRRARREKARIYWGDEMGLRSDHQAGRSYAPKGRTPVIPGTGQRFRANVLSAITNRGHLAFMVFKSRLRAPVFLRFLRRLVKQARRKAFLIVDSHPVHRSRAAQRWLEANAGRIEMFFLPAYSPELNPDEMLNQDVKTNAVGKKRPHNRPQMMRMVRGYLDRRRENKNLVKRYFHEESVRYAAA
jgi:transposase